MNPWHYAQSAGIQCISLPTPFLVGDVNVYVVDDDPLTLIDCGPNSGLALHQLEVSLAVLGFRVEDLKRIVISHQHVDHLGLINVLKKRSNADVLALDLLAPVVENFDAHSELDDELGYSLLIKHGVDPALAKAVRTATSAYHSWGSSAQVTHRLEHGKEIEFANRNLSVLHRPGHSPSDTLFWDQHNEILIGADH